MTGRHVKRLLRFAIDYPGWHTYGKDRSTVNAIRALVNDGFIEVNQFRQFRLMPSVNEREAFRNNIKGKEYDHNTSM